MYLLAAVLIVAALAHAEEGLVVLSIFLGIFFVVRPSLEGDKTTNGSTPSTSTGQRTNISSIGEKKKW